MATKHNPQSSRRTTVLDVARQAGVSQGTVSRVLTGKNWVSEESRQRVEEAVRALGYVPNALAQGLKAQRTRMVAALVSDMANPLHGEFLSAAEETLRASGYQLIVANTHASSDQELELLALFRAGRADGLIIAQADETHAPTWAALKAMGLPVVFHDREAKGLGDAVIVDHRAGSYAATRHLIGLGHRRIALLTTPSVIRPGRERTAGYERALREAGLEPSADLIRGINASSELSFSEVKTLLALKTPPTAIICLGTRMLAGVLSALTSSGLEVPRDMSLVGVGDTDLLRLHRPAISSVRWDIANCGRMAASLLIERLEQRLAPDASRRERHVPVELVLRESTAAPPRRRPAAAKA